MDELQMTITHRSYQKNVDFERIKDFLTQAYILNHSTDNWFPSQFENSRDNFNADNTHIWENELGEIVAAATPERPNIYFLHFHPNFEHLTPEVGKWVEEYFLSQVKGSNGNDKLAIVLVEGNEQRERGLTQLGFAKGKIYGLLRFRDVNASIPEFSLAEGFKIRTIREEDYAKYAETIRAIFGHGEFFNADIVRFLASSSWYNQELDLVAVDTEDNFASVCTFRMDPASRITELEPMGTHPNYRRLGLGKALLAEGFRRLQKYKPSLLFIGGAADNPGANRLYDALGFTDKKTMHFWVKDY